MLVQDRLWNNRLMNPLVYLSGVSCLLYLYNIRITLLNNHPVVFTQPFSQDFPAWVSLVDRTPAKPIKYLVFLCQALY